MNVAALRRKAHCFGTSLISFLRINAAGVVLAVALALIALGINLTWGGPAMVYALVLGFVSRRVVPAEQVNAGINFSAKPLLRLGVGLLGAGITFQQVSALGLPVVALAGFGVASTIGLGLVCARLMGLDRELGLVLGGAVAICGTSAALAIASVLPRGTKSEANTLLAVVGVTALSTIAMVVYPLISIALGLSERAAGIFFGAAIHDVAQVVGAGYAVSDFSGETATVVKLLRVACLVPVVAAISLWTGSSKSPGARRTGLILPWFLGFFVALSAVASFNLLPLQVMATLATTAKFLLITAIAALGYKTSAGALSQVGMKPVLVLLAATAGLALLVLVALAIFPIFAG